jgi:MtN3 and saliva related transmembrane protein
VCHGEYKALGLEEEKMLWHYIFKLKGKSSVLDNLFQSHLFINIVGIVAGIFTATSMLPQVIKTLKEKEAEDVSPVMLVVLITGISFWVFYGILRNDLPIIVTNGFSLLLNLFMLYLRWKYRKS